ncbi:MAG: hypothetical protein UR66_C0004G0017 [Candidatus Moranbacteria bacterium GW2011_GWE1_35_17]|nr:MAG: hypothetical protein UR66_C0004G0017 [Candidatus Moranbacteria bacterium GW2011_GWE1_35_17]KKP69406.1 MAG: hypothetical protein UR65_C0051G0005 [Candidatus Moranbacteria bacterium GW2011_GWE2_35_164]KKP81892.1 MAG: hypothetical protein UR82_C0049G0002 [Candidatus Moranbacteria bacterium GW2011_GWF1_35_5]KKP85140.1 MAG: hypothetical protein UR83_C0004G0028 [Candidatus Moranbacteria bacterium GW2011_GWF2_35_54]
MRKFFLVASVLILAVLFLGDQAGAVYEPLEPIPGTSGGTSAIKEFPAYVNAIYKFAMWSVGIAALLMISIGGFMYFTAAGNNSKMESGKKVIADALYGLIAVLFAWIILNTINPDLVNISVKSVENLK